MVFQHHLAIFTLLASAAFAQNSIKPWEITRLVASGAPYRGNLTCHDPLTTIAVEIQDTNEYPGLNSTGSRATQCIVKSPYCSPPYHQSFNCTEVPYGTWTFSFFPSDEQADLTYWSPGQSFVLAFRLLLRERGVWYEGQASFAVGENMRGLCSAGGVCSFRLKEELVPLYVNQTGAM